MRPIFRRSIVLLAAATALSTAAMAVQPSLGELAKKTILSATPPAAFRIHRGELELFGGVVMPVGSTDEERRIAGRRAQGLALRQYAMELVEGGALAVLEPSDRLISLLQRLPVWQGALDAFTAGRTEAGASDDGRRWFICAMESKALAEQRRSLNDCSPVEAARLSFLDFIGRAYDARRDGHLAEAQKFFERAFELSTDPPTDTVIDYCRVLAARGQTRAALRVLDGLRRSREEGLTSSQRRDLLELRRLLQEAAGSDREKQPSGS